MYLHEHSGQSRPDHMLMFTLWSRQGARSTVPGNGTYMRYQCAIRRIFSSAAFGTSSRDDGWSRSVTFGKNGTLHVINAGWSHDQLHIGRVCRQSGHDFALLSSFF
eukprot:379012-Rhodomonas_salina.1